MRKLVGALLVSLVVLTAACGDDDTPGGTGSSSGASSSGGSSSSGSGSACNPEGTWGFNSVTYTGQDACDAPAKGATAESSAVDRVFTKNSGGTYTMTEPSDPEDKPVELTLDAATCTLTGTEETAIAAAKGTDGKSTKATLKSVDKYVFTATSVTYTGDATITAEDTSVAGFPCALKATTAGTKK